MELGPSRRGGYCGAMGPHPGGLAPPRPPSGSTWVGSPLLRSLECSIANEVSDLGWQAGQGRLSHNNEEKQSSVFTTLQTLNYVPSSLTCESNAFTP